MSVSCFLGSAIGYREWLELAGTTTSLFDKKIKYGRPL